MQEAAQIPELNLETLIDLVRVFPHSDIYADTLISIFSPDSEYSPEKLSLLDNPSLEEALENIAGRLDVNQLRSELNATLSAGEGNLRRVAYAIFNRHIAGHIQVPLEKQKKPGVYTKTYNDVRACCHVCSTEASGIFDKKIPLESIVFIPEQVLYANNLQVMFSDGFTCHHCGSKEFNYQKTGESIVLRERMSKDKLKWLVKEVTRATAEEIQRRGIQRNPKQVEDEIADALFRFYKSIRMNREPNGVQYDKLYKIFEWIRRRNIQIEQLPLSQQTADGLGIAIDSLIPLPYAVIKMRVKFLDRIYKKMLEVAYGLVKDGEKQKELRDVFGIRFVLPTEADCYNLDSRLKQDPNFKIEDYTDHIKVAKENGYQSLHLHAAHNGIMYSVQIRTHEMDRKAETDPKQAHDTTYTTAQIELIKEKVPYQVRRVFAAILGVDRSPLLAP